MLYFFLLSICSVTELLEFISNDCIGGVCYETSKQKFSSLISESGRERRDDAVQTVPCSRSVLCIATVGDHRGDDDADRMCVVDEFVCWKS